jgi:hypothetical protein
MVNSARSPLEIMVTVVTVGSKTAVIIEANQRGTLGLAKVLLLA